MGIDRIKRVKLALLFFTTLGLIASILGYMDYRSGGSLCPAGVEVLNCGRVYSIPQAVILGIHLSDLALAYFILLALTLTASITMKELLLVHAILSITGLSVIPYLVYLELMVAKALCLYCTIMHISILGSSGAHVYRITR